MHQQSLQMQVQIVVWINLVAARTCLPVGIAGEMLVVVYQPFSSAFNYIFPERGNKKKNPTINEEMPQFTFDTSSNSSPLSAPLFEV